MKGSIIVGLKAISSRTKTYHKYNNRRKDLSGVHTKYIGHNNSFNVKHEENWGPFTPYDFGSPNKKYDLGKLDVSFRNLEFGYMRLSHLLLSTWNETYKELRYPEKGRNIISEISSLINEPW